jgi:hypothetical protein
MNPGGFFAKFQWMQAQRVSWIGSCNLSLALSQDKETERKEPLPLWVCALDGELFSDTNLKARIILGSGFAQGQWP